MHQFSLFQNPIELAHSLWKQVLVQGDLVVDATCGNGYDTLALAKMLDGQGSGVLHAIDIQKEAIVSAQERILGEKVQSEVYFHHQSHESFPDLLKQESVKLIVYNLGYLPGGDKSKTTLSDSTLKSVESSMRLIKNGGIISITAYPGHHEGELEDRELQQLLSGLDRSNWCVIYHQFINRRKSPSLYIVQKSKFQAIINH